MGGILLCITQKRPIEITVFLNFNAYTLVEHHPRYMDPTYHDPTYYYWVLMWYRMFWKRVGNFRPRSWICACLALRTLPASSSPALLCSLLNGLCLAGLCTWTAIKSLVCLDRGWKDVCRWLECHLLNKVKSHPCYSARVFCLWFTYH